MRGIVERISQDRNRISPQEFVDACIELAGPVGVSDDTRSELLQAAEREGDLEFDTESGRERSSERTVRMGPGDRVISRVPVRVGATEQGARIHSMTTNGKEPTLVIVQLTGGNDFMNTVIPYSNSLYYDFRPVVGIPEDKVLPIDDQLAFNPNFAPVQNIYDRGNVAIIQGVGYPDSSRSHFRSMDIWHTCEPDTVATEGWLGKAVRELDPDKSNPLTAVSFGRGLPRALVAEEVTVTSVGDLDTYGLMNGIEAQNQRDDALDLFKRIYTPAIGSGPVTDYLARTGIDVLRGADMLKKAPEMYESTVEYASNPIATSLRDVAARAPGRTGHPRLLHAARRV